MTTVLDDRYVLASHDAADGWLTGHDRLLDRDVDVVLLDPVTNAAERASFIRALRRSRGLTAPAVSPVLDIGSDGTRPYLVVPRATARLDALLQHPVPAAVQARVARDVVSGVLALAERQLRPRSLRPSDLRVDDMGRVQLIPTAAVPTLRERLTGPQPPPAYGTAARAAVREEVRQFFQYLLSAGTGSAPDAVVTFARDAAGPSLLDLRPVLDAWLDREGDIQARGAATPVSATRSVAPVVSGPVVSAPVVSAPVVSAPVVSGPVVSAPVVSAPVVSAPVATARVVSARVVPAPVVSAPVVSAPVVSDDEPDPEDVRTRRIVARLTAGVGIVLFVGVTVLALVTLLSPI